VLTWVTLLPIALIIWYANIGGIRDHLKGSFGGRGPETPPGATQVGDEWLNQQLAKASAAAQAKNYTRAVEIYDAIIAKTRDEATWQPRKQALLQQKALEERKERRDKLKERLEMAQGLASEQKFDDAMAVLRNIGQEDRTWLKAAGVGVEIMENAIREDQAKAVRAKQLDEKLVTELAQADALRTGGKLADALKVYTQIASTYPADLVRKRINLEQMLQELQARLAVVAPTPGGTAPTPGSATVPPDQVATVVADMLKEAAALEKAEKFAAALAKLEEIKQRFEQKSWPEGLEKRIRDVKAKKEALEFFGVEGPKKAPKTP
jgi:tetratricopeptide (TPR) repeat protein